jgi:hypothetical protein
MQSADAMRTEPTFLLSLDRPAERGRRHVLSRDSAVPAAARRPPGDGDPSTRAFRYCEAVTTASAFAVPLSAADFTVQWDGTNVLWTYESVDAVSAHCGAVPGFADYFDGIAAEIMFSRPSSPPEPGVIRSDRHIAVTRPG